MKESTKENIEKIWQRTKKYVFIIIGVLAGISILFLLMDIWLIHKIYSVLFGKSTSALGLDIHLARATAIIGTAASLIIIPWAFIQYFFKRKRIEVIIIVALIFAACSVGVYFSTQNIYFDRKTGDPIKYYIKTNQGFKFSNSEDFDPIFGAKYKAITKEVIEDILFFEKTGYHEKPPILQEGVFFDIVTGEPVVWYSIRPDRSIYISPLAGYDNLTGDILQPITKEIVVKIQKQKNSGNDNYFNEPFSEEKIKEIKNNIQGAVDVYKGLLGIKDYGLDKNGIEKNFYLNGEDHVVYLKAVVKNGLTYYQGGRCSDAVMGPDYEVILDKLLFKKPYVLLGAFFYGKSKCTPCISEDVYIIDSLGEKHTGIIVSDDVKGMEGIIFSTYKGIDIVQDEKKLIFFKFNYFSPENLSKTWYLNLQEKQLKFK